MNEEWIRQSTNIQDAVREMADRLGLNLRKARRGRRRKGERSPYPATHSRPKER
jgi:hypothetical protein